MRKLILVVMILTLVFMFACKPKAEAMTWCFGPSYCKEKAVVKANAMGEPTEVPSLAIFPSYTVGLNAIYLLEQEGLYTGPNMNIAKLFNITTLQAQYAMAITENEPDVEMPNYYGINAVVTVADVIKKLGGDPGEFLLVFNPALGYSGRPAVRPCSTSVGDEPRRVRLGRGDGNRSPLRCRLPDTTPAPASPLARSPESSAPRDG